MELNNMTPNPDNTTVSSSTVTANPSLERNKVFNLGIVGNSIRRFWPLWLAYGIVLALLVVGPAYSAVGSAVAARSLERAERLSRMRELWRLGAVEAVVITFVASLISAVVHNDHLFSSRAATFVGSLPMRRGGVYVTFFAAGLLPLVLIPALAALVMLPLCVSSGGVLPPSYVGLWLVLMVLLTFIFYAMAQLACHLAGTRPVAILLYLVINFLAPCLETAANVVFAMLVYGLGTRGLGSEWVAPVVGLMVHGVFGDWDMAVTAVPLLHWNVIGGYCAAALVAAVLAGLLFGRRRLEAAGDSIAFAQVRPPLKYLAGISLALLFGIVFRIVGSGDVSYGSVLGAGGTVALGVLLALGAFYGVLFAEMIIRRSARVLRHCWCGGLVLAGIAAMLVGVAYFDVLGFQSRVPRAGDVESVTVQLDWSDGATLSSPEAIDATCALHHDIASWRDQGNQDDPSYDVSFVYHLADGSDLERHFVVHADYYDQHVDDAADEHAIALVERTMDLLDTREARESRYGRLLSTSPYRLVAYLEYYLPHAGSGEAVEGGEATTYEYDENAGENLVYYNHYLDSDEVADLLGGALRHDLLEERAGEIAHRRGYVDSETSLNAALYVENRDGDVLLWVNLDPVAAPETTAWFAEHHPEVLERLIATESLG